MQDVRPFIQIYRFDLSDPDYCHFEKIIMNTKNIQMVEWMDGSDFVAFVCNTDHPEGVETIIEDYGSPKIAERRYHSILTVLGANDGTSMDREKAMRKAAKEKEEIDEFLRNAFRKAQEAGYNPFKDIEPEVYDDDNEYDGECKDCQGGIEKCCKECEYTSTCKNEYHRKKNHTEGSKDESEDRAD